MTEMSKLKDLISSESQESKKAIKLKLIPFQIPIFGMLMIRPIK